MTEKKEVAILKRAKISEAQQYVLLAVLGASIFLGAAASLVMHFVNKISFNINVIAEEERAIAEYSDAIKKLGVCRAPAGSVYTDAELASCIPDEIDVSMVPGTLRANILEQVAANKALNSVPREKSLDDSNCINPLTEKTYTYKELQDTYNNADTAETRNAASQLIKSCSALRVIPDALPSTSKPNKEALLASLNYIFIVSGWLPDLISPAGDDGSIGSVDLGAGISAISVALSIEADSSTTMNTLYNIERSIREFYFSNASIEWSNGALKLESVATAFYIGKSTIEEKEKIIKPEDSNSSSSTSTTEGETE